MLDTSSMGTLAQMNWSDAKRMMERSSCIRRAVMSFPDENTDFNTDAEMLNRQPSHTDSLLTSSLLTSSM